MPPPKDKLFYIANIRLPTEKAHGLQIMKTCEALARQGIAVELIVPRRKNRFKDDPFVFYETEKVFTLTATWCLDFISLGIFGSIGFWLEIWTFYLAAKRRLRREGGGRYYTRDLAIAYWLSRKSYNVYYELHTLPDRPGWRHRMAWERAAGLVTISDGLKNELLRQGVPANKLLVARDAVDVGQFDKSVSHNSAREILKLPFDKKIVLYVGHLYEWKGAGLLVEAVRYITDPNVEFYLVGGTLDDIEKFRRRYHAPGLHIIGWQYHRVIPQWLTAADVLVLPTSAKQKIGAVYNSPMKLFEYMLSKRPIIAADIPSLREVLDGTSATFFPPDDATALAGTIQRVLAEKNIAEQKANHAYEVVVKHYSWQGRAARIKNFIYD